MIWSAVRMPATSGTQAAARDRCELSGCNMLIGVYDKALADQRVQRLIGDPGDGWLVHDVPDKKPVEGAGQRMIIVAHADGALYPPVRRVQPVGMVMPGDRQARPRELGDELAAREDPDVAALGVVVLVREPPEDPLP